DALRQQETTGQPPSSRDDAIGARAIDRLLSDRAPTATGEDDVTLLLLTARSGASTIRSEREGAVSTPPSDCEIRVGRRGGRDAVVAISGRAIWKHAPLLREACIPSPSPRADAQAVGPGPAPEPAGAIIDLSDCAMLDSTVLGTLHELSTTPGLALRLQNVSAELRGLFEELAMTRVLSSIGPAEPLPAGMVAAHVKADAEAQALVLRAHEVLAGLSPKNAEEFAPVIELLRGQP
ncbi:MAG: hypothetical protein JOZ69_07085, partial [Myxococcales bacterium]|nr:hypothetical protein [Myxococcales bacterium]